MYSLNLSHRYLKDDINKEKDHEKIFFNGEGMVKRVEINSLQV
jgi:hypothetical protein